jgi:hypothetical protein
LRLFSNGDITAPSIHPFQLISVGADSSHDNCIVVVLDVQSAVVDETSVGTYEKPSAMYMFALHVWRLLKNASSSLCRFLISRSNSRLFCCIFFLFLRVGARSTLSSRSFRACFFRRTCRYVTQLASPFSRMSLSCRNLARSTGHVELGFTVNKALLEMPSKWLK